MESSNTIVLLCALHKEIFQIHEIDVLFIYKYQ